MNRENRFPSRDRQRSARSALGNADRYCFRSRPPPSRPRNLGLGRYRRPLGRDRSRTRRVHPVAIGSAVPVTLIGIPAATRVARASRGKIPIRRDRRGRRTTDRLDRRSAAWKTFLAGFILFRVFDIVKPPPVRQLEKLPDGAGIVLDDVAAGVFAFVGIHLLLHFGVLR